MASVRIRIVASIAAAANIALAGYIASVDVESASAPAQDGPLAPNSTLYSDGAAPDRYRGNFTVVTVTDTPAGVDARCRAAGASPPEGWTVRACIVRTQLGPLAIMPNPCGYPDQNYASLFCHEGGHVNGWPSTHGD